MWIDLSVRTGSGKGCVKTQTLREPDLHLDEHSIQNRGAVATGSLPKHSTAQSELQTLLGKRRLGSCLTDPVATAPRFRISGSH